MGLANQMRVLTNIARVDNSEFDFVWKQTVSRIKEKAIKGYNEICWYDAASEVVYNDKYRKYKDALADRLLKNGFKIKKGYELGKGMGSWETPYIIW